ncbi:hypothetical protein EOL73_05020 [Candidatus Saccharibacteria bacterium]|nr:hypothetical protein [Candidatus Saccharibacteria bacterium]
MRKLQSKDVFNAMRAISKANLKEELKPVLAKISENKMSIEDAGIEGILAVMEIFSAKKSEQAIYEVLAGPFEMTAKEVEELDLNVMLDNLIQLAQENNLKRFFTLLEGMISTK